MLENLIYSQKKAWFEEELSNVPDTAIAFIGDTKEIYALGLYFGGGYTKEEIDEMLSISKFEFVDLGLPSGLKWATCNVGATKPEDFGLYFAWGETQGYSGITSEKGFYWGDYKYSSGQTSSTSTSFKGLTKYNNKSTSGTVDNLTILEQVDDAAYQSDNTCRMPTKADFEELITNTTSVWETLNGVNGRRFTSKTNGNSIFVPAAGNYGNGSVYDVGSYGYLWSSSLNESISRFGWVLNFSSDDMIVSFSSRDNGLTVRAVQEPNNNIKFNPSETVSKVNNLESQLGDINAALDYIINGPKLITFTISGFEYQAEEGMTWEEYCNSEYNVDNFKAFPDYYEGIALPNDKFNASRFSFAWASHTADDFYGKVNMNEVILSKEYFTYLEK